MYICDCKSDIAVYICYCKSDIVTRSSAEFLRGEKLPIGYFYIMSAV